MKNVEFANELVKLNYQDIIEKHRALSGIVLMLVKESKPVIIKDIVNSEEGAQIIINQNNNLTYIDIDFLKKKIYLDRSNMTFKEIYDDYPRNSYKPVGYLFQKERRMIIKNFLFDQKDNKEKVYHYELNENGNKYVIIIKSKKHVFDEERTIEQLLYRNNRYNNIRDLFVAINEIIGTNHFDLKLADAKGSNITIEDGLIKNYIEYRDNNNEYEKISLENNDFYIEKKVKEKYEDNLTSYIKKIGERNGKEKRKN